MLTRADIGIAMGSMGSDAAIEAADVVLMDDDIRKIASIVRISRKTLGIVKQNIVFALAVKAIVLVLGAFGVANMWEAVFADVGGICHFDLKFHARIKDGVEIKIIEPMNEKRDCRLKRMVPLS